MTENDYLSSEERKDRIVSEFKKNSNIARINVDHKRVSEWDISFRHYDRVLPAGLLEFVGEYGDLRIEGTDGEYVDCVVLV